VRNISKELFYLVAELQANTEPLKATFGYYTAMFDSAFWPYIARTAFVEWPKEAFDSVS
jgi:hypothetical protein